MAGWLAAVGLGGSFLSGAAGSNAEAERALDSADIALWAGRLARRRDREMFDLGQEFMAPYRDAGLRAMPELEAALYNMDADPSNDYMTREALRKLKMRGAATGKLRSGTTARGVGDIYSDAAQREHDRRYQLMMDLVNSGAGHAFGAAGSAEQAGSDVGNLYLNAANSLSAINSAQGRSEADLYKAIGQGFGGYMNYAAAR